MITLTIDKDAKTVTYDEGDGVVLTAPLTKILVQHVRQTLEAWRDQPDGVPIVIDRYNTAYGGCVLTAVLPREVRKAIDVQHPYPANAVLDTQHMLADLGLDYPQMELLQQLHDSCSTLGELKGYLATLAAQVVA